MLEQVRHNKDNSLLKRFNARAKTSIFRLSPYERNIQERYLKQQTKIGLGFTEQKNLLEDNIV